MKIIKGNYGQCEIRDCLEGIAELEEDEFELCFTDTLWGKDYDGTKPHGINRKTNKPWVINYEDKWDEDFHINWFMDIAEKTKAQVVCTGKKYYAWWLASFSDTYKGTHDVCYNNGQGMGKTAKHSSISPYICFGGDWWKQHKFFREHTYAGYTMAEHIYLWQTTQTYIRNGFLNDQSKCIHPSPKDFETWCSMIQDLNPQSVIDPFGGSCVLGEVCEYLGIKWKTYEIEERYSPLIEERIQRGIQRHKSYIKPTTYKTPTLTSFF